MSTASPPAELRVRLAADPVCVSGAGPSLVVFERPDRPQLTLEAVGVGAPWRILRPGIRGRGFEVEIGGDRVPLAPHRRGKGR